MNINIIALMKNNVAKMRTAAKMRIIAQTQMVNSVSGILIVAFNWIVVMRI